MEVGVKVGLKGGQLESYSHSIQLCDHFSMPQQMTGNHICIFTNAGKLKQLKVFAPSKRNVGKEH